MILTAAGVDDQFQKLWHCFGQLNLSHCFIIIVIVAIVVIVVVTDFIIFIVDFIIFLSSLEVEPGLLSANWACLKCVTHGTDTTQP